MQQSRSQSFVPLDQRSENESSGSNHYERTKEITEFWLSGSLRICIYGACLKWLLPELSFSDRWSRGTKLWERDCACKRVSQSIRVCKHVSQTISVCKRVSQPISVCKDVSKAIIVCKHDSQSISVCKHFSQPSRVCNRVSRTIRVSFATLRNCRDQSNPLRSLVILPVPQPMPSTA